MCPEGYWHGPPARAAGVFAFLTPETSGGLFLDFGLSRLKISVTVNRGEVSPVVSSPPSPQIRWQVVLGLVSLPEVPHAVVSPAVHRPHMCCRYEANSATPVRRRAEEPSSVDGP